MITGLIVATASDFFISYDFLKIMAGLFIVALQKLTELTREPSMCICLELFGHILFSHVL